ncbi:MAG: hypothetical protein CM15mP77_1000 [Synechococcus sp.]|nr:MAG: hypothetical protein CM15mP77_1000 [Synechococcus sp.]
MKLPEKTQTSETGTGQPEARPGQKRLKIVCPQPRRPARKKKNCSPIYRCFPAGPDPKAELDAERKRQIDAVTKDRLTVAGGSRFLRGDYWSRRGITPNNQPLEGYLHPSSRSPKPPFTVDFCCNPI